jgi:hypothetical protein
MPDIISVIELADKLGIIQVVKGKLMRQPYPAADKLVTVLEELSKIYLAIDTELVRYLSLTFDPSGGLAEERAVLLTLEGGLVETRIGEARGHCQKIANIYTLYLDPWFHNILSPDEAEAIGDLFNQLSISDVGMVASLNAVGKWLTSVASNTLDLVDAKKYDEANAEIKAARRDVLPSRLAITKVLSDLRQLQAEFIGVSGIV